MVWRSAALYPLISKLPTIENVASHPWLGSEVVICTLCGDAFEGSSEITTVQNATACILIGASRFHHAILVLRELH